MVTHNVGKNRIPTEQANGQMKRTAAFFDRKICIDQIGLADLIFCLMYLMTNFKLPFIQEWSILDETNQIVGRPCKAEIRWYNATDNGLIDVRPTVELWGTEMEIFGGTSYETWRKMPVSLIS